MKSEAINTLDANPYPNNFKDFCKLLRNTLYAIRKEPTLQIIDKQMYDDLKKCEKEPLMMLLNFFHNYSIEDKSYLCSRKVIARDKDGVLVCLDKNLEGQYIEVCVPLGAGEPCIRFGLTPIEQSRRHIFYMTDYFYVDYHDPFSTQGCARKMKVKSAFGWDTRYCDVEGKSDFFTNLTGTISEFVDIFR